jgi:hypothetical protein
MIGDLLLFGVVAALICGALWLAFGDSGGTIIMLFMMAGALL